MARTASDACRVEVAGEARWATAGNVCSYGNQEDIARSIAKLSPPDVVKQELPSELACDLETRETYVQAHAGSHSGIWTEVEGKELRVLNATDTSEAAGRELQRGANVVSAKWVYSWKVNELGHVVRAEARLVALRFAQREGIDFFETFSPCPSVASIRLLAAIACEFGWDLCNFDAEQAFVQSKLDKVVFIRLPSGCGELSSKVVKLGRSLYGLRQSSRTWHNHLMRGLKCLGFESCAADVCVMRLIEHSVVVMIVMVVIVHVDDIFPSGSRAGVTSLVLTSTAMYPPRAGCRFSRDTVLGTVTMSQQAVAKKILPNLALRRRRRRPWSLA